MSNSYWFKHDFNTSNDRKIRLIDLKYQGHGYSLYMKTLEYMGLNNGYMEEIDIELIAMQYNYDKDKVNEIFEYFFQIGLLIEEGGKILSPRFIDHYNQLENKRKASRENGKLGGRPPKNKDNENGEKPNDNPEETHQVNKTKPKKKQKRKEKNRIDEKREEVNREEIPQLEDSEVYDCSFNQLADIINILPAFENANHEITTKHIADLRVDYSNIEIWNTAKKINDKDTQVKNSISTLKNWLKKSTSENWQKFDKVYPKSKSKQRYDAKIFYHNLPKEDQKKAYSCVKSYVRNYKEDNPDDNNLRFMPNALQYLERKEYEPVYDKLAMDLDIAQTQNNSREINRIQNLMEVK